MRSTLAAMALFLMLPLAAHADTLVLVNGDSLQGTLVETTDTEVIFEHVALGRITLGLRQLQAESIEDAVAAAREEAVEEEVAAAEPEPEGEQDPHPGLFGTRIMQGWEKRIGAGISGNEGNTQTAEVNVRIGAKVEDEDRRWDLSTAYFYSRDDGSTTKNQVIARAVRDFLLTDSPWFFFLGSRYDYDEFEAWEHRISGTAGIGYEFFERETWDLLGRLGAGVTRTFGSEKDWTPEGVLGLEGSWQMNESVEFSAANTVLPALNDIGEFRNISRAGWTLDISHGRGLKLAAEILNEYDSQNPDKKNDLKYLGSLLYDF